MKVIVQVSVQVANELQYSMISANSMELLNIVEKFGLRLYPLHHETDDPNLRRYYALEVIDDVTAQGVLASLRQLEAVQAAYVKPLDGLP